MTLPSEYPKGTPLVKDRISELRKKLPLDDPEFQKTFLAIAKKVAARMAVTPEAEARRNSGPVDERAQPN